MYATIFVQDLSQAYAFYTMALGFIDESKTLRSDISSLPLANPYEDHTYVILELAKSRLLMEELARQQLDSPLLTFSVKNFDVLMDVVSQNLNELSGDGISPQNGYFQGPYETPGGRYVHIRDPFGNLLLFTEW